MSVRRGGIPPTKTDARYFMTKFPTRVQCYGRTYRANNGAELWLLLGFLRDGQIALANRYRVGKSWPRGKRSHNGDGDYVGGTPVWFRQSVRGGYGYDSHDVPALFVRRTSGKRWCIDLLIKDGRLKQVYVSPSNVRHRR